MTKLIWTTEKRKVNDLVPFEKNPRTINDKQLKDLTKSLKKFNLVEIPAIDKSGKILAGHQRLKVLQLLGRGDEKIDVRVPNRKLTTRESEQYLISSNALGGDWDFEKLKSFDLDLLTDIGFDQIELANLWDDKLEVQDEDFDIENEIKKIKKPKTKPGDLIQLGTHKLYCADSTNPENLKKLFGKERTSFIYSDPVYNLKGGVNYNSGVGGKQNYGGNVNDDRSDDEYKDFLKSGIDAALSVAKKNVHVFYYCDQNYIWLLQTLYKELGIENKRVCLWIKNGHNPTPGVAFNKCYEPCVYGVKGKPYISSNIQNLNEVMNKEITTGNNLLEETLDELDVWMVKRLSSKDYKHATSKPPKLHEKAIRRCSKPGDIILDSFAGSGSTLIAGEQLKRKVYTIEKEPIFCDLIIRRYEKLTNNKTKIIWQRKTK